MKKIKLVVTCAALALVAFSATAWAASAATPDGGSILDYLTPVIDAFRAGHYWAAGALAVVLSVAAAKRYLPGTPGAWVNGNVGGPIAVLVASWAATAAVAIGDGKMTFAIARNAFGVAFATAGGYAIVKSFYEMLKPLVAKAPSWVGALYGLLGLVFESGSASAEAAAKKAGDDAVAASPPAGADGVVGKPEEI